MVVLFFLGWLVWECCFASLMRISIVVYFNGPGGTNIHQRSHG
jgi:hypothetical protein